jgi:hypothetical protein
MRISKIRLALPAAACVVALGVHGVAAWGVTPSARVRPARNLADAQSVTVHWHGFDTTQVSQLLITECTSGYLTDGMQTHCDLKPTDLVLVNPATAKGSSPFTVHTGNIGDGTCGTSATDADCVIAVTGIGGAPPLPVAGQSATAPIAFAVS